MMSRFWRTCFGTVYRLLAWLDPLIRSTWRRMGIGNVVELRVAARNNPGTQRSRMIGTLLAGGHTYIGHPDGDSAWTRDLRAAQRAVIRYHSGGEWPVRATLLDPTSDPEERELAIRATGQHPFPGNLIYRLGRRHVRATGVYFRLDDDLT
ncbi:MAG TPA: hypothetical protein VMZ33_07600 [Candidatus Limnocylindrales bacterium]|nr:hypothetical protein [Candidatus Limnocylindrales bacterium]